MFENLVSELNVVQNYDKVTNVNWNLLNKYRKAYVDGIT